MNCTNCQPQWFVLEYIGKKNLRLLGPEKKNVANIILSGQLKSCINCKYLRKTMTLIQQTCCILNFTTKDCSIPFYH